MKLKNTHKATASAILAGSLMFAGAVNAATTFTEDFETGTGKWQTSWGTYATATNFSGDPHSSVTGGGVTYANLISSQGATSNGADVISNTVAIDAADFASIDAGTATWDASAWVATYNGGANPNAERVRIDIEFFSDAGGTVSLGAASNILEDTRAGAGTSGWLEISNNGTVVANARSFQITYGSVLGNDAYADNISFSITPVPEPSSTALLGLGGLALILRRRK